MRYTGKSPPLPVVALFRAYLWSTVQERGNCRPNDMSIAGCPDRHHCSECDAQVSLVRSRYTS